MMNEIQIFKIVRGNAMLLTREQVDEYAERDKPEGTVILMRGTYIDMTDEDKALYDMLAEPKPSLAPEGKSLRAQPGRLR